MVLLLKPNIFCLKISNIFFSLYSGKEFPHILNEDGNVPSFLEELTNPDWTIFLSFSLKVFKKLHFSLL